MDSLTGKTYESYEAALADGVPSERIVPLFPPTPAPKVKRFSKNVFGSFKNPKVKKGGES
jgi:hypothetical protein